jgi:hypothetical protein
MSEESLEEILYYINSEDTTVREFCFPCFIQEEKGAYNIVSEEKCRSEKHPR